MSGSARQQRQHEESRDGFARALRETAPEPGPTYPCPYLPGREARQLTVLPRPLRAGSYHALMDLNFRRLGRVFYRPACGSCHECRILRVRVDAVETTRSQRRCLAKNRDVEVAVGVPEATPQKWRLYQRYLKERHDGSMDGSWEEFSSFLYTSPIETREIVYRLGSRLLAVCLVDCEPLAWSAVYCYYDPREARRAPGVFNVLTLLEQCRVRQVPWLYLGYYVAGSRAMSYKAGFHPGELLENDGRFHPVGA
jgi:arginine-tRNA-protein transferase